MDNNTLQVKLYIFLKKVLQKARKKSWHQPRFIVQVKKYDWVTHENLFL